MWPCEVKLWFHSWYRGGVETLDAKYNLVYQTSTLCVPKASLFTVSCLHYKPWFSSGGIHVATLTVKRKLPALVGGISTETLSPSEHTSLLRHMRVRSSATLSADWSIPMDLLIESTETISCR